MEENRALQIRFTRGCTRLCVPIFFFDNTPRASHGLIWIFSSFQKASFSDELGECWPRPSFVKIKCFYWYIICAKSYFLTPYLIVVKIICVCDGGGAVAPNCTGKIPTQRTDALYLELATLLGFARLSQNL